VSELASARFGSRPSYRPGAKQGIEGIRAIPWQFGWTQIRLILPGWLGVGTALAEVGRTTAGLEFLQRMASVWPFFDDLLAKIEMVCAKADLDIARAYITRLGGDTALLATLEDEYRRTVEWVTKVRGASDMLVDLPVLRTSIALRNPYVDALSALQIALLEKKRSGDTSDAVEDALVATLNGVAQGLRNTG
jgi:phosphoenolpyruvate carboxylase